MFKRSPPPPKRQDAQAALPGEPTLSGTAYTDLPEPVGTENLSAATLKSASSPAETAAGRPQIPASTSRNADPFADEDADLNDMQHDQNELSAAAEPEVADIRPGKRGFRPKKEAMPKVTVPKVPRVKKTAGNGAPVPGTTRNRGLLLGGLIGLGVLGLGGYLYLQSSAQPNLDQNAGIPGAESATGTDNLGTPAQGRQVPVRRTPGSDQMPTISGSPDPSGMNSSGMNESGMTGASETGPSIRTGSGTTIPGKNSSGSTSTLKSKTLKSKTLKPGALKPGAPSSASGVLGSEKPVTPPSASGGSYNPFALLPGDAAPAGGKSTGGTSAQGSPPYSYNQSPASNPRAPAVTALPSPPAPSYPASSYPAPTYPTAVVAAPNYLPSPVMIPQSGFRPAPGMPAQIRPAQISPLQITPAPAYPQMPQTTVTTLPRPFGQSGVTPGMNGNTASGMPGGTQDGAGPQSGQDVLPRPAAPVPALTAWTQEHQISYQGLGQGPAGTEVLLGTSDGPYTATVGSVIPGTRILIVKANEKKVVLSMDEMKIELALGKQ